jgi:hypothetical protein
MIEKDVTKIFDKIENNSPEKIDGKILACAMKLVYHAGLKRNEIPILTIGDVYGQDGTVRVEIETVQPPKIPLQTNIRIELLTYHDYLKSKGFSTASTDPLFPGYYADSNDQEKELKRIARHLKEIDPDYNKLIHYLHETGISDLEQKGVSEKIIADQFRIMVNSVQDSTNGTITKNGKAIPRGTYALVLETGGSMERLINLDYSDIKNIKGAIDDGYDEINSLSDEGLKKSGQGSKAGAFKLFIEDLINQWK